ncbi:MAG: DUF4345 domain-containing protein [Winogradskyella sp.]|uniref:DUF4345 domain-containing protein n=1 Tax=Winogradskyella sp. TaxID=1883156 RepID=UPI0017C5C43F|nr:DUF4345 domain-containing protein [Winogradskyella sp.]
MTNRLIAYKIHLVISVVIVLTVAIVYGFNPSSQFNIIMDTVDEHNFFKATMGLYIGFAIVWIMGLLNSNYFKTALLTNIAFMLGLGLGRCVSWWLDGPPTLLYRIGTIGELLLGFYGLWVINSKVFKKP